MTSLAAADEALATTLKVAAVIVVALAARWLVGRAVDRLVATLADSPVRAGRALREATGPAAERRRQRARTLGSVLRSAWTIVLFLVATLTVLAILDIPFAPLLASAGVGGVALGFGAQSLVKDFLSGIFMLVEDQYGVGDVVDTGEVVGTVQAVSLRVTTLRDADGVVWYIRNGEILRVGNHSQGWSTATVDIPVAYDESPGRVMDVLRSVAAGLREDAPWDERVLQDPEVVGIESVTGGAMTVRVLARCAPNESFPVSRELRERCKVALDEAGVRGPIPPAGPPAGSGSSKAP